MTNGTQEVAKVNPLVVFKNQLDEREVAWRESLPPHIPTPRFKRVAFSAAQNNPDLVAADRLSLLNALSRCAADGVVPDGRQAIINVYKDNNPKSRTCGELVAQYQIMVDGMKARFLNSGHFKELDAEVVREGDEFRYWIDENGQHLIHVPQDSGKIIKVYARAILKDGGKQIRVMSRVDVERRRAVSKAKDGPMWSHWWDEAAKKTVMRNLLKRLPSSSDDMDRWLDRDAEDFGEPTELPDAPRGGQQVLGVSAALDTFGGRAPAVAEDQSTLDLSQPRESTNDNDTQAAPPAHAAKPEEDVKPEDRIANARERGVQARRDGVQRRAVPGEYRAPEREAESNAWRAGWDNPDA